MERALLTVTYKQRRSAWASPNEGFRGGRQWGTDLAIHQRPAQHSSLGMGIGAARKRRPGEAGGHRQAGWRASAGRALCRATTAQQHQTRRQQQLGAAAPSGVVRRRVATVVGTAFSSIGFSLAIGPLPAVQADRAQGQTIRSSESAASMRSPGPVGAGDLQLTPGRPRHPGRRGMVPMLADLPFVDEVADRGAVDVAALSELRQPELRSDRSPRRPRAEVFLVGRNR